MMRIEEPREMQRKENDAIILRNEAKELQRTIARQQETLRRVVKEARRQRAETTEMLGAISAAQEEMRLDRMQQVFGNAACAAGPWHQASEEPPSEGWYLVTYTVMSDDVDLSWNLAEWSFHEKWQDVHHWAEVRMPDHIPDAGKMIEKGQDDEHRSSE